MVRYYWCLYWHNLRITLKTLWSIRHLLPATNFDQSFLKLISNSSLTQTTKDTCFLYAQNIYFYIFTVVNQVFNRNMNIQISVQFRIQSHPSCALKLKTFNENFKTVYKTYELKLWLSIDYFATHRCNCSYCNTYFKYSLIHTTHNDILCNKANKAIVLK